MNAVLISIQPKWCELIASGKKTVEVRKTKPKLETPFKVYIYETQGRTETPWIDEDGHEIFKGRGQVIGEFVCDCIMEYCPYEIVSGVSEASYEELPRLTQLSREELLEYCGNGTIYTWHISDLVIYDKPKELNEFKRFCEGVSGKIGCRGCEYYYTESNESIGFYEECGCDNLRPLKRPPQSWCYVEGVTDERPDKN
jgi:predicted transcriptional regulator